MVSQVVTMCVPKFLIHWQAKDDKKIFDYNYEATKLSIERAMKGEPSVGEVLAKKGTAKHPFSGAGVGPEPEAPAACST